MVKVASVVEGHGEVAALPVLIRRICDSAGRFDVEITKPHRIHRNDMVTSRVGDAVRIQRARAGEDGIVVVLFDADDDAWESVVRQTRGYLDPNTVVAVAVREYEAWFLADLASLRGHPDIAQDASFESDPEGPRDAKKQLESRMTQSYRETIHQQKFSALVDLANVRLRSPSFARFADDLLEALRQHPPAAG